jgi:hypothetical protein
MSNINFLIFPVALYLIRIKIRENSSVNLTFRSRMNESKNESRKRILRYTVFNGKGGEIFGGEVFQPVPARVSGSCRLKE